MTLTANVVSKVLEAYNKEGKRLGDNWQSSQANKKFKRPHYCYRFNSENGCPNNKTAEGCIGPNGQPYRHGCNVRVPLDNRACNAKDHNAGNHV